MRVNGEKIKLIRESKSLSKEAFANQAGVSRQAIEAWERGSVGSFRTLAKIAGLLNVPEKFLVEMD